MIGAAWIGMIAVYNYTREINDPAIYPYYLLAAGAVFSAFIPGISKFTVYIFPISFFIMLALSAAAYKPLLNEKNPVPAFIFLCFTVFSLKGVMLESLTPLITVPVSLLVALFLCVSKVQPIEYYLEEKNMYRVLAVLYPLFLLQCFIGAVVKNSLFH